MGYSCDALHNSSGELPIPCNGAPRQVPAMRHVHIALFRCPSDATRMGLPAGCWNVDNAGCGHELISTLEAVWIIFSHCQLNHDLHAACSMHVGFPGISTTRCLQPRHGCGLLYHAAMITVYCHLINKRNNMCGCEQL